MGAVGHRAGPHNAQMAAKRFAPVLLFLATLLPAGCRHAQPPVDADDAAGVVHASRAVSQVVPEAMHSTPDPRFELDSLAAWRAPDGRTWLVVSAKSTHQLVIFDAETGALLRTVGGKGSTAGAFKRPNGIAISGDVLWVVERDNQRVQLFSLPGFQSLGSFGNGDLRSPYGLWLRPTGAGTWDAYVTDSFMYGEKFDRLPPAAELAQRVKRFRVSVRADGVRAELAGMFGDTGERTALHMVESIAGDPRHDRLLIADEDRRYASTLREYTLDGRYTGRSMPSESFGAEAEGVALWECGPDDGYWIAVDQLMPLTIFHLFDRGSLAPVGSFTGKVTAHTDGIALHREGSTRFPRGALYAVDGDVAVSAFDLRDVARALHLPASCLAPAG